ncbi:hypothetical protein ABIA95_009165 [Bradyrhizobium sp. LA8.1]
MGHRSLLYRCCLSIILFHRRTRNCSPYSPDFDPIENAFAKLKALLRKAAVRSVDGLWSAIGRVIDLFTPNECVNYFKAAGYEPS